MARVDDRRKGVAPTAALTIDFNASRPASRSTTSASPARRTRHTTASTAEFDAGGGQISVQGAFDDGAGRRLRLPPRGPAGWCRSRSSTRPAAEQRLDLLGPAGHRRRALRSCRQRSGRRGEPGPGSVRHRHDQLAVASATSAAREPRRRARARRPGACPGSSSRRAARRSFASASASSNGIISSSSRSSGSGPLNVGIRRQRRSPGTSSSARSRSRVR